jgi:hypothetical protein
MSEWQCLLNNTRGSVDLNPLTVVVISLLPSMAVMLRKQIDFESSGMLIC